ncbi:MAG: UDP-N-acetylglucosamine 2-epimerase [Acidimicrobiia bacterium]|nr:UDP-N-acetylglucosamine 2-epimerase [Acidimicrobiia bacterium]
MSQVVAFIGTKAQYIKTAPVLHGLDRAGIGYRLVDSGQHATLATQLRDELQLRAPAVRLGGDGDVESLPQAAWWALRLAGSLASRRRLRADVFGPDTRLVLVHGDTPSTLLATLLARRAGLRVAHLEAGLRSHSLLHPFPEELIRLVVMRLAHVLFAPDQVAVDNLRALRVRGRVVAVPGNTSRDAVTAALVAGRPAGSTGPAVVTMHRVENLHRPAALDGFVDLVERIAAVMPTRFVVHGPTGPALAKRGLDARLAAAGVSVGPLVPHGDFVRALAAAPLVVTDGGSIQEECARLGVPTLLWRARTERPDGLDANVVLARYDPATVDAFLADPDRWRRPPAADATTSPAAAIVDGIVADLARSGLNS